MTEIGKVISSSPNLLIIEVDDVSLFENNKDSLQIGKYLKVKDGNHNFAIAVIRNISAEHKQNSNLPAWKFEISAIPVGALLKTDNGARFQRGTAVLPVPTESALIMDNETLNHLFSSEGDHDFELGVISANRSVPFFIHGDRFFGKHSGVVGSTGSGKSCAVAHILQNAVGISGGNYTLQKAQNNSHIVIFDLHAEYAAAFRLQNKQNFTLNELTVDSLQLPYWLMNAEELESMFIESNENNSHNQVSIFKRAVILNKKKYNKQLAKITYDTPCFFSLAEVINFIDNMNNEVIGRQKGEGKPKLVDESLIQNPLETYFESRLEFVPSSTTKLEKASNGPFNGEFTRFVSRLETRMEDERLRFLLHPTKPDGSAFGTNDFDCILQQFLGYLNHSNISIIDLSGIPFEVLSVTVSLISRHIFDFCFHYTKLRHETGGLNDIPVLLVCEEAHNYLPSSDASMYRASRKSIERVAKEGRKYGLGLMIVSQRPSEVSPTIFSQCNNFIALRLTNSVDQSYIKGLLPENISGISDTLSTLGDGEALVAGDAAVMPTIVKLPLPQPQPNSSSVKVYSEWKEAWREISIEEIVNRWRGDSDVSTQATG